MMQHTTQLVITAAGSVRCRYAEAIDLSAIGALSIERASHVEPNDLGQWQADLAPVGGPLLGPFPRRSQALLAEQVWLDTHWLPLAS